MRFLDRHQYSCPYCHERLLEELIDGKEVKICKSLTCMQIVGEKGRTWEVADYGD